MYDENFINGNEDIDAALILYLNEIKYSIINYRIGSIGGGTLGNKGRMLKDISNLAYLNQKYDLDIVKFDRDLYEIFSQ